MYITVHNLFLAYVSIWEPENSSDISKIGCFYSSHFTHTYLVLLLGFGIKRGEKKVVLGHIGGHHSLKETGE